MSVVRAVANFKTTISSKITSTDTGWALTDATDTKGTTIPDGLYGFTLEEGTNNEEHIVATIVSGAITAAVRGIDPVDGQTSVAALKKSHRRGASIKITNHPGLIRVILAMLGELKTGASLLKVGDGTDQDIYYYFFNGDANKPYLKYDKTTNKVLLSNDGINEIDIAAGGSGLTAGNGIQLIAGAITVKFASGNGLEFDTSNLRVMIKASEGLGRDANGLFVNKTQTFVWTAQHTFQNILDISNPINWKLNNIAFSGTMTLLNEATTFFGATDLTGAEAETLSNGSDGGALHYHAAKCGTYSKNLADASGTDTIAHGLGRTPKYLRISAVLGATADSYTFSSIGVYNGSAIASVYTLQHNYDGGHDHGSSSTKIIYTGSTGGNPSDYQQSAVPTMDATNISLAWTKVGAPTGVIPYVWEVW